jgi:hypothetical protein
LNPTADLPAQGLQLTLPAIGVVCISVTDYKRKVVCPVEGATGHSCASPAWLISPAIRPTSIGCESPAGRRGAQRFSSAMDFKALIDRFQPWAGLRHDAQGHADPGRDPRRQLFVNAGWVGVGWTLWLVVVATSSVPARLQSLWTDLAQDASARPRISKLS